MAYKDLYKGRYGSTRSSDKGYVFGTFPNGNLSYDVKNFERERDDGVTIIDLVPECRVFIFGTEVTKDIQSVSITHTFGGNKCTIRLTNPRDRYVVTKQDLIGNWREDKDFLATYDYDYFKRIPPSRPELLDLFGKNTKIGKYGHTLSDQIGQVGSLFKPQKAPTTRMIFETKFYSGMDKRVGDFVFDYRDPVMVFMKGRFSPYWYFAFTGVIESWDDIDTWPSEQTISIRCEDPLYLLKREKFSNRCSLIQAGNFETVTRNKHSSTKMNIYQNLLGAPNTTIDKAISILFFGADYQGRVANTHPILSDYVTENRIKSEDLKDLEKVREVLEKDYRIGNSKAGTNKKDSDLMLTYGKNPSSAWWSTGQAPTGYLVKVTEIGGNIQKKKLNEHPFGPWLSLYAQLNVIDVPSYETADEILARYNSSVRYWEVEPKIKKDADKESKQDSDKYTGWADTGGTARGGSFGTGGDALAIGVAGIHPALTYEFINHFNILPGIWSQLFEGRGDKKKLNPNVDKLNLSPHEKIRELVAGSVTENRPSPYVSEGSNANLFRPRLFVVVPRKFADKYRSIIATGLGQVSLLSESVNTTYDALREMCEAIQFTFYSSPMGDIFVEPEMHDFHPTEFVISKDIKDKKGEVGKIEERSIIQKKKRIKFRAVDDGTEKKDRGDTAYMFNAKANHPFFLMEKDRVRCTQTFKPENVKTHVRVAGAFTKSGSIVEGAVSDPLEGLAVLSSQGAYSTSKDSQISVGDYIADGFGFKIDRLNLAVDPVFVDNRIKYLKNSFNKAVWAYFIEENYNSTIQTVLKESAKAVKDLIKSGFYKSRKDTEADGYGWKTEVCSALNTIINDDQYDDELSSVSAEYGLNLSYGEFLTAKRFASYILELLKTTKQKKSKKEGGIDAATRTSLRNSTTYNDLADINSSTKIKDWLAKTSHQSTATVASDITAEPNKTTKDSNLNLAKSIKEALANLAEPIALNNDAGIKKDYTGMVLLEETKQQEIPKMLNVASLKELAASGVYTPRLDIARKYGYTQTSKITNKMINSGGEAMRYSITMFNKLYGKAHMISMDIVGRPELQLNRPYYCERKDAIGLLENYTLKFNIGSDSQSSVNLTYVRKNSITYKYTLHELDELVNTPDNEYFSDAAVNYYKSISDVSNNFTQNLLTRTMIASGDLLGSNIAKAFGSGKEGQALGSEIGQSSFMQLKGTGFSGGVYSAHDWLGHMEYDNMGRDDDVSKSSGKEELKDHKLKKLINTNEDIETVIAQVHRLCTNISSALYQLIKVEMQYDQTVVDLKAQEDKTKDLKKKKDSQSDKYSHEVKNITAKISASENEEIALKNKKQALLNQHKNIAKDVYGVESNYTNNEKKKDAKKPAGERTPSIDTLKDVEAFFKKASSTSLYKIFIERLKSYNVDLSMTELYDDRVVGSELTGFKNSQTVDLGWKGTTPFYAKLPEEASGGLGEKNDK